MKLFLDTADVGKIQALAATGLVDGVTTNPTLIMKAGRDQKTAIQEICKIVKGPVSVEGVGETCDEMVKDARIYSKWAPNVVAKVPMTVEGLKAVRILEKEGIPCNVTLVFSVGQALLVAKAGASYCSPFVGRLDDVSEDGMRLISDIMQVYENFCYKTEVIVASVRHPMHISEAAKLGAHICTIPPEMFEKLFRHPLTDKGIKQFLEDHQKALAALKK